MKVEHVICDACKEKIEGRVSTLIVREKDVYGDEIDGSFCTEYDLCLVCAKRGLRYASKVGKGE